MWVTWSLRKVIHISISPFLGIARVTHFYRKRFALPREDKMAITNLYHTCLHEIQQLRSKDRVTRVRNVAWLMAGLFMARSVHLSHIARKIPGKSQQLSKVKKLSRLLNNRHIQVRSWYEPIARRLLEAVVSHGLPIRLLLDGTKVGNGHQLLMVALAYRRRALPIAWTWVRCVFRRCRSPIPADADHSDRMMSITLSGS